MDDELLKPAHRREQAALFARGFGFLEPFVAQKESGRVTLSPVLIDKISVIRTKPDCVIYGPELL